MRRSFSHSPTWAGSTAYKRAAPGCFRVHLLLCGDVPYGIAHWHSLTVHQEFHIQFQRIPYFVPSHLCRRGWKVEVEQTVGVRQAAKPALC